MRLYLSAFAWALSFAISFAPQRAFGQAAPIVLEPRDCILIAGLGAGADRTSAAVPVNRFGRAGFWVQWVSLAGSVDATVKVQVASSAGPPTTAQWVDKSGASFNISGTDGAEEISVVNLTEAWARLVYSHVSVSGGTITANCNAKSI